MKLGTHSLRGTDKVPVWGRRNGLNAHLERVRAEGKLRL